MTRTSALAFTVTRSDDVIEGSSFRTTTEKLHGLLRLADGALVVQWRLARTTEVAGTRFSSEEELEAVREATVPLAAIAGAAVRQPWPRWLRRPRLEITAADLRAFESLTGAGGLERVHPARLQLVLQRADRLAAEEFAADLMLAIAERGLGAGDHGVGARALREPSR